MAGSWRRLWLGSAGLILTLAAVSCPSPQPPPAATPGAALPPGAAPEAPPAAAPAAPAAPTDWIGQVLKSTVKIFIVTDDAKGNVKVIGGCSGSLIDPSGIVLTNWHCVGRTDLYQNSKKTGEKVGIQHGETYHSQGLILVGLTEDPRDEPVPTYVGVVRQGTADLDIAVIKLFKTLDERQQMPRTLPAPVLPLGDSETLKPGDPVHVFGYPGVGGETVTKTSGEVSGFYKISPFRPGMRVDSFKMIPAPSGAGNSGGPVTSAQGEQMGIYSFGGGEAGDATLAGAFFINLAKPFIEQARNEAFDPIKPRQARAAAPAPAPPTQPPPTAPPATAGAFGAPAFGTAVQGGQLQGGATSFPAGTKQVVALFDYRGMRPATPWGYVLNLDGEAVIDKPNGFKWEGGTEGKWSISFNNGQEALPNGRYELNVYLNNQAVQRGSFSIAGGAAPPPAAPPAGAGVTVVGQILDADTKRGIADALFVVLKPGVTAQQWVASDFSQDMVAASGQSGRDGSFRTDPPLPRGQSYSVAAAANGYKPLLKDGGLTLARDAPAEFKVTVTLQK